MTEYFKAEWMKIPKGVILAVGLLFLALSSFIGLTIFFFNYDVLIENQMSRVLWGQLTFYNSQLLFPAMLAIFSAMILLPEFEQKTFEMLRANHVSSRKLLMSKFLLMLILVSIIQGVLFIIYLVTLYFSHIPFEMNDVYLCLRATVLSVVGSTSVLMLHSYIMVKTKNFAKSVGVAAIGSFAGFIFIMMGELFNSVFPYSQPMIGIRSRALVDMSIRELIVFLLVNIIYSTIFYYLTLRTLEKKD
ncbi:ABC transporter permease [Atopobacter phocae]|uniref:ABC transporter permease n=1 Tax=Atopobacter phocae TaxID=136492 RepID=UPI0004711938|nr:ABC transporter permease [Atopobacter phocae]